jgi:hypothetical protein
MPPISIQQAYDAMQRHRLKCKSKQVGRWYFVVWEIDCGALTKY